MSDFIVVDELTSEALLSDLVSNSLSTQALGFMLKFQDSNNLFNPRRKQRKVLIHWPLGYRPAIHCSTELHMILMLLLQMSEEDPPGL